MSNDHEADARNAALAEPPAHADGTARTQALPSETHAPQTETHAVPSETHAVPAPTHPADGKKVSRGWLIAAVAAGGALLLALSFGGGIATGLGIGALTRGGLVAEQGPGQIDPGHGGEQRRGPGSGPGRDRPEDGGRQDRQNPQDPAETPSPAPTPGT